MMKGNEKDCICEKPKGKHRKNCDAYRLAQFSIKMASVMDNHYTKKEFTHNKDCPASRGFFCNCHNFYREATTPPSPSLPSKDDKRVYLETDGKRVWKENYLPQEKGENICKHDKEPGYCNEHPFCKNFSIPFSSKHEERSKSALPHELEGWEAEFDSAFNWADQIKGAELERWKLMYGFTPTDIKSFISKEIQAAREKGLKEQLWQYGTESEIYTKIRLQAYSYGEVKGREEERTKLCAEIQKGKCPQCGLWYSKHSDLLSLIKHKDE